MKNSLLSVLMVGVVFFGSLSLNAQEKGGKKKAAGADSLVTQFMKQLEKAELTAEQTAKIKEMYTKVATDVQAKRTASGITFELMKKRTDASKAAKEAGKKGKEIQEAGIAAMGLTADQAKVYSETDQALGKVRIEIGKLLSPEQLAKLPDQAQASMKERISGNKGKKKK
ncbi:MAG: hypothetical protein SGI77_21985 [Pirellulaceae bacterium]|nr:hypothetical protein [Pirellulaceae bacterium]